ncbi:MAG TPA: TSUP family transporter [Solirubrobacteraceae bacterium]|nr:TSUP family transporter [Solirubrobacteraceae bacterium]
MTLMPTRHEPTCRMNFSVKHTKSPLTARRPRMRCALIGVAAGAFSGLFGVGGGSIIVPGALAMPEVNERQATAASLLAITVMALVGSLSQIAYGNLRPLESLVVGLPAVLGVIAGTALQQRIEPATVRTLFAALLIAVAALTVSGLHPGQGHQTPLGIVAAGGVGVIAGVIAGLLGVGGGTLFVPALVFFAGLTQRQGEATSLLAIAPVSLVGAASQYRYGNLDLSLALPIALASVPGALLGVVVVNLLPARLVAILFGLLLLWIAQRLIRRGRLRPPPAPPPPAPISPVPPQEPREPQKPREPQTPQEPQEPQKPQEPQEPRDPQEPQELGANLGPAPPPSIP